MTIETQEFADRRRIISADPIRTTPTTYTVPSTSNIQMPWRAGPIVLPTAIIVDVDGTLVDVNPALHHILDRPDPDWDAFQEYGTTDAALIENTAVLVVAFQTVGVRVIVMTGRHAHWREGTERHLAEHGVQWDALFTRAADDGRPDVVVKRDLYEQHIAGKYNPILALDDNPSIIPLWRELGIPVHVVPGWNTATRVEYGYRLPPPPPGKLRMGDGVQTPGLGYATEAWARMRADEEVQGPCTVVQRVVTIGPWEDAQPAAPSGDRTAV